MKKALFVLASIALLAACNKEQTIEIPKNDTLPSGQVKICFNIDAPGDETKAVKQGWENGDKISFWFDGLYADPSATKLVIRDHDLALTFNGSAWESSYQRDDLAAALMSSGERIENYHTDYLDDFNHNGYVDDNEWGTTFPVAYHGQVYALWVSGNNLIGDSTGWTRDTSHPIDQSHPFYMQASFIKPANTSPMVLSSGFLSSDYDESLCKVDYIYDPVGNTLRLVSANNINMENSLFWKFYTNFQVTVTGLEPNHVYTLTSPQFGSNFMYVSENTTTHRFELTRMINAATASGHFGLGETATSSSTGEAVFFGQGQNGYKDYTFTLTDKATGKIYTCTKLDKYNGCTDTKLAAIKLNFADFNHWDVVGSFNNWGSASVINMKRVSAVDNNDLRNGDWEADIIGYTSGQEFKLYFNNDWTQGVAGMKYGWSKYGLNDWGNNTNYLSGDSDNINIVIDGGYGDYHLFFSYPSHWFVITKK